MGLHRLLGMRVGVPNAEALAGFYGEMGLADDGSGRFAATDGDPQVHVAEASFRRLLGVDVGASDEQSIVTIAGSLAAMGLDPTVSSDSVSVIDPTTQVEFTASVAEQRTTAPPADVRVENRPGNSPRRNVRAGAVFEGARPPRRLGHIVIGTPDIAATQRVLVDGLGFKVSDEFPGIIAFLRCSTDHHNVALVETPVPILQHYSWECDDVDHVGHTATKLLRADEGRHAWGFGRHFVGSNYYWYLRDPAGSFVELYSDMDVIDDDEAWEREGRTPVGFEHVANSWGPQIPMEFIAPSDLPVLQEAWAKVER